MKRETRRGARSASELTEDEVLVLEIIDALGGEARAATLRALAAPDMRPKVLLTLIQLAERRLLLAGPEGSFTLHDAGRRVLAARSQDGSGSLTAWQRKHLPKAARTWVA